MADKRVSIVFDASMEVGKMKSAIDSINKSLQQTSVNIPKHTTQALTKLISSIQGDMTKLEGMTGANLSPKNSKEILKIQDTLVKNFKNLKTLMGNMGQDFKVAPSNFFPDDITDKIEKATKALREYQQALAKGPQSEGFSKISEELKQAQKQQREYEAKARTQLDNKEIAVAAKAELKQQKALQEQIKITADEEKRQAEERIKQAQAQQRTEKQLEKIRSDKAKAEKRRSDAQATADEKAAVMATKTRTDTKVYGELSASKQKAEAKVAAESTLIAQYDAEIAAAEQAADKIAAAEQEKIAATQKSAAAQKESSALSKKINAQSDKIGEASGKFTQFSKQAEEAAKSVAELTKKQEEMQAGFESSSLQGLIAELKKLDITPAEQSLDGIKEAISKLSKDAIKDIGKALEDAGISAEDLESQLGGIGRKSREFAELTEAEQRAKQEMDSFKRSVMDFFSITNSVYLFKRAIQSAFETVKELDAVMTETAVVTDFTVGDMWEKLPEYADQASALGASIKDLYGATTLYYQQGLNSEQAMGIGIETMKMARIANMEAADATQAMTAALRGFNMEINETNATRINDVYSELAAITAADTNQIATAMTKTASIASSANMEFETTAALLAQIIETTQEAPETAGTAMKTIIARFTEVKKLFDEGMLSGEDSEGEAIEINKIDAALRTVGISLTDFLKGKKGIDDIFLELASKWDTLDLATQRYIATTAAGSRQQSRFIAMMSNYDRTMELVNAANNSAGASQEQFEKTLDSMQAKLQKLTNAWNEFTMGLANNEILKGGIDMLTWLLETINKLTDALSGGSGLSKSFLNLTTVVGALAGGKGLLEKVMAWAGGAMGIEQRQAGPKEQTRWQRSREYAADQNMGGFRGRVAGIFGRRQYSTKTSILDTQANRDEIIKKLNQENIELDYRQPANEEDSNRINNMMQQRQDIINQLEREGKITDELSQKYQDLGGSIEGLETSTRVISGSSKALEVDLQAVGAAALVAGGALGLLASVGEQQGWSEELINGFQTASAVLTGFGSVLSILPMFLGNVSLGANAAGLSLLKMGADGAVAGTIASIGWAPFLLTIGAVIVAVIALVAAFKAIHATSPEGKLEAATEAANDAAEAAENAAQAYEHLASALDSISGKSAALENLAVGTTEWKNAIQELNGEVLDLVEQYPELAQFIDSKDGYLRLDTEGPRDIDGEQKTVKDILSDYQENKIKAQSASAAAKLQKQQAQQNVDYNNLNNKVKVFQELKGKEKLQKESELAQQYYNSLGTAAIGPSNADIALARQRVQSTSAAMAQAEETGLGVYGFSKEATDELAKAIATGDYTRISDSQRDTLDGIKEAYNSGNTELWDSLKEYGQGLIAADAATKVFTDSLLSNALVVAEVSDEQKANMMNFMSSEQIDSLVKNKKEEITKDGISDEEKNQYAKTMGYEFINGKFYVGKGADQKEVAVSDDSIAAQLAGIQAQDDLTGRMKALDGALNKIDENAKGLPSTFERMTEKGEGAALTFTDIENMKTALENTEEGSELDQIYKEYGLKDAYGSYENFINFITNSTKLAEAQHTTANKKLNTIGMADYTKDMNLDIGQTKNVADLLYESVIQSGKSEGENLAKNLKDGLEEEGEGKKLAEALGMIDLDNIDSIKKLSEYLEELEYAGEIDIDDLEKQIIEATNASKKFSLDNLKEELKSVQDLIKDIEGREETDRIYSEEDYKKLIESGKLSASDFVMRGIDEYVYIGETNEQLISALQENTAALLGETQEKLREAAEKSQTWNELKQGKDTKYQYDLLGEIATGKKAIGEVSPDLLIKAMSAVGLSTEDIAYDETGAISSNVAQIIKDRITSAWNQYGSATAISGNLNALEIWGEQSLPQMYYSQMSGQEILEAEAYTDESGKVLDAKEDQAARTAVLDAKLKQQEGGTQEADYMVKNNEAWEKHNDLVKAAVVDSNKYEKKLTKLADTIEENADALQESKKGTREYQKALNKVTIAAKEAFGDNITEDFVEENIDLFKEFAKGSEEAVDGIRNKMVETYRDIEVKGNNVFDEVQNAAMQLDGLNFDIYGHADASQIFSELAAVMGSAEAAAQVLESLGYSVTWVEDGTFTDKNGVTLTNYRTVVTNTAGNVAGSRGGGGGGGGGGGSEWENPYDKLYNVQENIDRTIREREQIERRYQRLLDRRLATAQELYKTSQAEIDALREQAEYQQKMLTGRQEMLQEEMDKNGDLQKYATADIESGQITIDWDLINSIKDEEEGKRIEEYISKLEELRDSMQESQDAIEEINDSIWEIEERGREEYMDLEERIKEAITENRQREIDTLEEINDSINEANEKLLDSIQSSIDKIRQDRENEKTEEELGEKQRRLAYLEQDTSGANALEILALQEEIRQGQEDYTDSLIDQKISELQEQNDKAAEQREKQITIMQNQLDWYIESGRIWAEVDELLKDGLNPQGGLIRGSKLEEVMKNGENWTGLSKIGQMDWLTDLETLIAQSMNWQMTKGQLENLHDKLTGQTITFRNANGEMVSGKVDEEGKVVLDDGSYYKDVYQWIDGGYYTTEQNAVKPTPPPAPSKPTTATSQASQNTFGGPGEYNGEDSVYYHSATYRDYYYDSATNSASYNIASVTRSGKTREEAKNQAESYADELERESYLKANYQVKPEKKSPISGSSGSGGGGNPRQNTVVQAFATGGLADFTGPAWLDGTKARPELVLSQRDTQNFIQLKDILSSIMSRNIPATHTSTENNGDLSFDIDINVESLQSDYDVEQVASKVKSMIVDNARYRNNNAISLTR